MKFLNGLTVRERVLVLALLPVAVFALGYQFVWTPLSVQRADYIDQIASYRLVTQTAALAEQSVDQAIVAPVSQNDTPLPIRVTQSGEASGIVLRRIEAEGDGVRVTLADTSSARLILWLASLEQADQITVTAIEIDRRPEPGTISARILLEAL